MIPEIKCIIHSDEDIVLIDVSKQNERKNRLYCFECLNQVDLTDTCQIKKISERAQEFGKQFIIKMNNVYEKKVSKVKQTMKQLITLKEKTLEIFDQMIKRIQKELQEIEQNKIEDETYIKNLASEITRKKLESIAEMLSDNYVKNFQFYEIRQKSKKIINQLLNAFDAVVNNYQEAVEIFSQRNQEKVLLQNQISFKDKCQTIASNSKTNTIIAAQGQNIVIWKQNFLQFTETHVLKEHSDQINALVMYQSGDMIISVVDYFIKLWKLNNYKWDCIQTIYDVKERINDIKLSSNQNELISASDDKLIRVWKLKTPENLLECVQKITFHENPVYWISISQDNKYMASSSLSNYVIISKHQQQSTEFWRKQQKLEFQGIIKRVFIDQMNQLLIQQQNPPKFKIFKFNTKNEYEMIQEINLNQNDDCNIMFPIFQIEGNVYLKNNNFIYVFKKQKTGQYTLIFILEGQFESGCIDSNGDCLILKNVNENQIQLYSID